MGPARQHHPGTASLRAPRTCRARTARILSGARHGIMRWTRRSARRPRRWSSRFSPDLVVAVHAVGHRLGARVFHDHVLVKEAVGCLAGVAVRPRKWAFEVFEHWRQTVRRLSSLITSSTICPRSSMTSCA